MNTLLLAELKSDEKDLLQTLILLEEHIFQEIDCHPIKHGVSQINESLDSLETIIEQCQAVIAEIESPLEQAEVLLNELYFQHLFIDKHKSVWPLNSFRVATSLNQRLMSPMVKAVRVGESMKAGGFVTD